MSMAQPGRAVEMALPGGTRELAHPGRAEVMALTGGTRKLALQPGGPAARRLSQVAQDGGAAAAALLGRPWHGSHGTRVDRAVRTRAAAGQPAAANGGRALHSTGGLLTIEDLLGEGVGVCFRVCYAFREI